MPYVHVEYPKFLYHKTKPAVVVHNEDEHKAMGSDWLDKPHPQEEETDAKPSQPKHLPAVASVLIKSQDEKPDDVLAPDGSPLDDAEDTSETPIAIKNRKK